jgi:hypothetical protein
VICHAPFLCWRYEATFPLWAGNNTVNGIVELCHGDGALVASGGQKSRFVDHICQIRTDHTRSTGGHDLEINTDRQTDIAGMDPYDLQAARQIGPLYYNLPIKAPGA